MSVVVSDTGPLHYLILCEAEKVLPILFSKVFIPQAVFEELQQANTPPLVKSWAQSLPEWIEGRTPKSLDQTLNVDRGELEAICLAREIGAAAILIDDGLGRSVARRCGLAVTGTVGVLEVAALRGLIHLSDAVAKLRATNARLDPELLAAALARDSARRK